MITCYSCGNRKMKRFFKKKKFDQKQVKYIRKYRCINCGKKRFITTKYKKVYLSKNNTTGYKGVYINSHKTFTAQIRHRKKQYRKSFKEKEHAAMWYDYMARKLKGKNAVTNFELDN